MPTPKTEPNQAEQRVIVSQVIDPATGKPQPDHWAKRVFISSGRGYGKDRAARTLEG